MGRVWVAERLDMTPEVPWADPQPGQQLRGDSAELGPHLEDVELLGPLWSRAGRAGNVHLGKGRIQGELRAPSRAWRGSRRAGEGWEHLELLPKSW